MFSHIPSSFEPSLRERRTVKAYPFSSQSFWPRTICVALLGALSMQSALAQGVPVAASNHGVTKQVQPGNVLPVAPGAAKDLQGEDPLEALLARVTTVTPVSESKAASIAASASASVEPTPSMHASARRDAQPGQQQDAAPQVQPVVTPAAASARSVVDRRAALLAAAERHTNDHAHE